MQNAEAETWRRALRAATGGRFRTAQLQIADCRLQNVDDILAKKRRVADILDGIKGRLARKP